MDELGDASTRPSTAKEGEMSVETPRHHDKQVDRSTPSYGPTTSPGPDSSNQHSPTVPAAVPAAGAEEVTPPVKSIYLFVNPTSGGNAAAVFTSAGLTHAVFTDPDIEVYIADIRHGDSGAKPLFLRLKEQVERHKRKKDPSDNEHILCVMAGGDGTVLWGMSELWEHKIDIDKVLIGVIPYGTGNDFAKAFGWELFVSLNPFHEDLQAFKDLVKKWLFSSVVKVQDVWKIVVTLHDHPDSNFKQMDSKTRKKKEILDKEGKPRRVLEKQLCNYFSIGIESRVGIGFDRHRTTSAVRNKMVYMTEGAKKAMLHRGVNVQKIIQSMVVKDPAGDTTIFDHSTPDGRHLYKCASLIASNIPSFSSGLDIWAYAARTGLTTKNKDDILSKSLLDAPQAMGDGLLEWVSFSGVPSLGREQILEGKGRRVSQGKGPFELKFWETLDPSQRIYFQVDGEFFQCQRPKLIEISLFKQVRCLQRKS